jgi:hypothetical protein
MEMSDVFILTVCIFNDRMYVGKLNIKPVYRSEVKVRGSYSNLYVVSVSVPVG